MFCMKILLYYQEHFIILVLGKHICFYKLVAHKGSFKEMGLVHQAFSTAHQWIWKDYVELWHKRRLIWRCFTCINGGQGLGPSASES